MMGRMNMGKQIATAPASRAAGNPNATRRLTGLSKVSPMLSGVLAGGANRDPKAILDVIMRRNRAPQVAPTVEKMACGGPAKKMAKGGSVRGDGCCMKGKTKGKMC